MTKSYKEIRKEKEGTNVQIQDACWSGYKQVGMKKKGNRQVPNCVPESVVNALFGKDYIYEVSESVADMYKGTVTPAQLAKMKQLWKTKKASDVTPAVKNFVKGLDQFTQMDIKHANIKYVSDLIEEFEEGEVDLAVQYQKTKTRNPKKDLGNPRKEIVEQAMGPPTLNDPETKNTFEQAFEGGGIGGAMEFLQSLEVIGGFFQDPVRVWEIENILKNVVAETEANEVWQSLKKLINVEYAPQTMEENEDIDEASSMGGGNVAIGGVGGNVDEDEPNGLIREEDDIIERIIYKLSTGEL